MLSLLENLHGLSLATNLLSCLVPCSLSSASSPDLDDSILHAGADLIGMNTESGVSARGEDSDSHTESDASGVSFDGKVDQIDVDNELDEDDGSREDMDDRDETDDETDSNENQLKGGTYLFLLCSAVFS